MKVGIVGSRRYTNAKKVKDFILKLKQEFGEDLEIVSGGQKDGADGYAKKFAKEMHIRYVEFPPMHYPWTNDCPEPPYMYGKPYNVKNYFIRNSQIAEYSDVVVAFIPAGKESRGTMNTIKETKKRNKRYTIIH